MNTMCQSHVLALLISSLLVGGVAYAQEPSPHAGALDTAKIEQLTGAKGKLDTTENVFKVTVPRSDLAVSVAGVKMSPATGFTSWAEFSPAGDKTMLMGDMVLQEDQINPVMSAVLENGIKVTALHNHFIWDTPKVMFMHIGGTGNAENLATGVGKVFAGSNDKAIVEGDSAMLESELQGVLKALRGADVTITAIHNHMVGESPWIVFLHYWGEGSVNDLAKTFKAALDTQSKA